MSIHEMNVLILFLLISYTGQRKGEREMLLVTYTINACYGILGKTHKVDLLTGIRTLLLLLS